jgi:2-polyprenyl-3-methyl-5-hydroxy-6-metoxy-1,4-benzoquinol methylase
MVGSGTEPPSYEGLDALDGGALRAAVLEAALELDVYTHIAGSARTADAVASAVGADPRALGVLLDALCPLGLLEKAAGQYRLSAAADAFLVRGRETFAGDAQLRLLAARRRLTDVIRSGSTPEDLAALGGGPFWAQYLSPSVVTWSGAVKAGLSMWHELGVTREDRPGFRILDVASGAGIRTFGLAREDRDARIVAIDTAPVLEVAAKVAERMGVSDQVTFRAGDIASMEFGSAEFDAVLFSYVLFYFDPGTVRELLARARTALKPGGQVVIRAPIADDERRAASEALLTAVDLLLWIPGSCVYAFGDYRRFLEEAGFVSVARHREDVIIAVRPA